MASVAASSEQWPSSQSVDPALTLEDTNALLTHAFPRMEVDNNGELQFGRPDMGVGFGDKFAQPSLKQEPQSPAAWQANDCCWDDSYDALLEQSYQCLDATTQLSGSLQTASWCSDTNEFCFGPDPAAEQDFDCGNFNSLKAASAGEVPQQYTTASPQPLPQQLPTVATPNDGSLLQTSSHASNFSCDTGLLVPTGYGSLISSPAYSSDSDATPLGPQSAAGGAFGVSGGGSRMAASLMPTIGASTMTRSCRLSAKPSDDELKEAIAQLQKTTSRVPSFSDEGHTITRAECLVRYREKKLRRLDVNTIRYMKRKINADRRPRIKGRFVKAEELSAYRAGLLPGQNGRPVAC